MIVLPVSAQRDDFDSPVLSPSWQTVRNLGASRWSLTERAGFLRLKGSTVTLDDTEVPPVYFERKSLPKDFEATVSLDFEPGKPNETAGLALRLNERQHYEFGVRKSVSGRELFIRLVTGSNRGILRTYPIGTGPVALRIRGFAKYVRFSFSQNEAGFREIGGAETKFLEDPNGLLNVGLGIFASGNGIESTSPADFDWFGFDPNPRDPYADLVVTDPSLPKGYTIFSVPAAEKGLIQKYPFVYLPESVVPVSIEHRTAVVYARYGDREMHADVFRPKAKGKRPALIIVHGGAWITGHYTMENPLAIALAKLGYVAVTVEYRLANEKKYPAQIHDLKAAVRWLRANAKSLGIDPERIGAAGASAGGHLVALLGATNEMKEFEGEGGNAGFSSRVQSVIDIDGTATFVDPGNIEKEIKGPWDTNTKLTGFTYAENPEIWKNASPITHVNVKSAPTLFLNSSSNRPFQQREEMAAKLNALGIASEIVVVPDTPHPFWLFRPWFDTTVGEIDRFFRKTMGNRK